MTRDLFGLGNTFRAMSPFQQAVNLAHQAARQRLETGGTAGPAKPAKPDPAPAAFVIPGDVDPDEIAKAIEAKLHEQGSPVDQPVLHRRAGGGAVVPASHLLRLGDGRYDKGRRFLQGIVNQIRARRVHVNSSPGFG